MKNHPEFFFPLNLSLNQKDKEKIYSILSNFEPNHVRMPNWKSLEEIPYEFTTIDAFSKIVDITEGRAGLTIFYQDSIQFHPHIDRHRNATLTNKRLPWRINFFLEQRSDSIMHWYDTPKGKENYWTRESTLEVSPWMATDDDYHYGEHPIWYQRNSTFETFPKSIWSVKLNGFNSVLVNTSYIHTVQQPEKGKRLTLSFYSDGSLYWNDIINLLEKSNFL